MQKKTELVQQLLAEMFAPLNQGNYLDMYYKNPT